MKILSIETSCDETAVSVVEANGGLTEPSFSVLGNTLFSQIDLHKEYGGVYPNLAKREHGKNFSPLLAKALTEANLFEEGETYPEEKWQKIKEILVREHGLYEALRETLEKIRRPAIDAIAVTAGPGLEPALWVGISGALALGVLWNIPVVPVNHMEGHITSVLLNRSIEFLKGETAKAEPIEFPAVALLVSGGHTELVKISGWGQYEILGQTRDDAVGEAFDKVARMIGLPYPGGPEVSRLAEEARKTNAIRTVRLPRPMMHSGDLDFSFSGLKTAVLYYIRDNGPLTEESKKDIAREFEDAVIDVLIAKTSEAIENVGAKTLIIGGGVVANSRLREACFNLQEKYKDLKVKMPYRDMSTDNSIMIAMAAYVDSLAGNKKTSGSIIANGNLKLGV